MQKSSGNVFLGHLGEWFFRIFSIMGAPPLSPQYLLEFSSPLQYLRGSSLLQNSWNRWWLETLVLCCYIELHIKSTRAPRSSQISISSHLRRYSYLDQGSKVFHPAFICSRTLLVLLLLTLNTFCILFYC